MWSSQLLLFFLLSLEFLLLVSEPITSCLDLFTRTSASRYCRCHGRILCLFLLCSSFILVNRPVLVSHFLWGFLLLPSPALCSNVLHLLPPPPSTLPSEAVCVCPSSALSYFKLFPFSTRSRLLSNTSCSALWGWDFLLFGCFCCCSLCISMHWEVLCQNVWYQCRSIANRGVSSCSHTFLHAVKSETSLYWLDNFTYSITSHFLLSYHIYSYKYIYINIYIVSEKSDLFAHRVPH